MGNRTIEKQCFIVDTITPSTRVYFQMMPEVTDSKSINWNQIDIIGRSHPILGYASSGPRTFSFTLSFFAHATNRDDTSQTRIQANINFLLSLTYPDYSGGSVKPPHKCILHLGEQVHWPVVAQDISVTYKPTGWLNNLPVHAEVSCLFIEAANDAIDYKKIRFGRKLEI